MTDKTYADLRAAIQAELDHAAINDPRLTPAFGKLLGEPAVRAANIKAVLSNPAYADQKQLWADIKFVGGPPFGYSSWHAWVNSPVKTGAVLRASGAQEVAGLRALNNEMAAMTTEKKTIVVYGDGQNDDYGALQSFLDGRAKLIHADGSAYTWPGTPGKRYAVSKTLMLGGAKRDMTQPSEPLRHGAWIGAR